MTSSYSAQELKTKAGRFRVLIIGRANAGKTTILKKICNTTDDPEVYNAKGEKIDISMLEPSAQRGIHDIENEMVFRTRPRFVFHDSRGFEAGGVDEMKKVKAFVVERSKVKRLQDQVHAIWYCIPMDNDRPITNAENEFFSKSGTGKVPVVVVYTKCEALEVTAISAIQREGYSYNQAVEKAPKYAKDILKTIHHQLKEKKYPPQAYVCLQELHKPDTTCQELVRRTTAVLNSENLQALFISTQQNSLELAVEYSLRRVVKEALQGRGMKPEKLTKMVFSYFPYHDYHTEIRTEGGPRDWNHRSITLYKYYGDPNWDWHELQRRENLLSDLQTPENMASLAAFANIYALSPMLQYIQLGSALVTIAEDLTITWSHAKKVLPGQLASAILDYQRSTKYITFMQEIEAAFQQYQQTQSDSSTFQKILHSSGIRSAAQNALADNLLSAILKNRLEG